MTASASQIPAEIRDSTLALLGELCAISSESGNSAGLRRVAARLGHALERHGLRVEIQTEDDAAGQPQPVLVARGPRAAAGHLLLIGHLDTVLPAIPPQVAGGRLIGTGALDMKGGLAMLVGALELLAEGAGRTPDDLLLVAVPDEEVGGEISARAVRRWSAGARAVLVLEPGEARGDGETLVAGRRGLTEWRLAATGRAAHSGLAYWSGHSALAAAADWCRSAQGLSRPGGGPTVNVGRLVAGTATFVDDLASHHDLLGSSRQCNVVPERARADGEARFLTPADGAAIVAELAALADRVAAERQVALTFTPGLTIPPVDPRGAGAHLIRRTVELAAARGLALTVEEDRGGISFPNFLLDPARVPVVDGLGPVGEGMHTREEWLDLGSLERRIGLLADLLATLRHPAAS